MCLMCPANFTTQADGSSDCDISVSAPAAVDLCLLPHLMTAPTVTHGRGTGRWGKAGVGGASGGAQVGEGTDLSTRYAVLVSFGVLLNGTALNDIARRVGVNASSTAILHTLVRHAAPPRSPPSLLSM